MRITRRQAASIVLGSAAPTALAQKSAELTIAGKPVELTIAPVTRQTARITIQAIGNGPPQAIPDDGALVQPAWGAPVARLRTIAETKRIRCGDLTLSLLSAEPLTIRIDRDSRQMVQEIKIDPATGAISFRAGDAPLLGLGQGGPQYDRRGVADRMGSGQGAYRLATHGGRVPIQLVIGTAGWAIFVHLPLGAIDLTGVEGILRPPDSVLPIDVFVIGAREPAAIMAEYAKITGLPEMPPLWSLGYQQSHRTLDSPAEIMDEAKMIREKKFPCDTLIYLGTDFCPNGWNTHNGEFTWNPKAFPDPKGMIDKLRADNFKVVLHIVIEGHLVRGKVSDPCTAAPLPSGRTPDGKWPQDRQVSCYWPAHKPLLDLGIDGWWPDQGDGLDPASRLARNRMYFEGQQIYRPNERVYALHRNGYAGMQRFASFLWSGDVRSTWETLKNHVPIAINTGLSGIPFWGTDIGGFVPGPEYTGEMYVRWFQFSAFNPLFRSHGREWRLHTPWGWNRGEVGNFRETPSYNPDPAELRNSTVEPICRKYLELRYSMISYLYAAVKESCETGLPIVRALWLHYPDDPRAVALGGEFLYGRDILVAPVVEKGATSRTVYLPRGAWYDFWTNEKHDGGREIVRKVDLETIPLYVRAGAILPLDPPRQYTAEKVDGPITLRVYPGADGKFSLYEDDGTTFNFRKGIYTRTEFVWSDRARKLSSRTVHGRSTGQRFVYQLLDGESHSL